MLLLSGRIRQSLWLIVAFAAGACGEIYTLQVVRAPGAPLIRDGRKKIMYGLDLIFDRCPESYWTFYDKRAKRLVVDCYEARIAGDPRIEISGRGVFGHVEVKNSKTRMALSGEQARINIGLDPGWHFKTTVLNGKTLRLMVWRAISGPVEVPKRRSFVSLYISVAVAASLGTFLLAIILGNAGD